MINIIHDLRRVSGSKAKLRVLKKHKDNIEFLEYLQWVYDPKINYYVSCPSDNTFRDTIDIQGLFNILREFSERKYVGKEGRIKSIEASKKYGELFRLALSRSLKAGVSITTINKAYPNLIRTFNVMLAKDVEIIDYPALASTKYDGVRLVAFVFPDYVEISTRAGKIVRIESLEQSLKNAPQGVYDGEIVHGTGDQAGRTRITGSINRILKGTSNDLNDYTFCIFDYLTIGEWMMKDTSPYSLRLEFLEKNCKGIDNVIPVKQETVYTNYQMEELFQDRLDRGFEGLILRYPEDPYIWKRTDMLIKKKAIKECILKCTGVTEGAGKYSGLIGALICSGHVKGIPIKVKVGTGLSDEDRLRPDTYYIGKNIEIAYNSVICNSLFLPRFLRVAGNYNI